MVEATVLGELILYGTTIAAATTAPLTGLFKPYAEGLGIIVKILTNHFKLNYHLTNLRI